MSTRTNPQPNGTLLAAAEADESTLPATGMLELARPECLRLLAATGIGRVVVSVPGWDHPLIRPVNYLFDESSQCVLLRSAPGSKLHALLRSGRAAFEIDGIDHAGDWRPCRGVGPSATRRTSVFQILSERRSRWSLLTISIISDWPRCC